MADIAIENGPVEIVDLPINSMVIFHTYAQFYQRVFRKLMGNGGLTWFNGVK